MSAEETKKKDANDEAEDEAEANYDELATYKQCLKLMKEGETVASNKVAHNMMPHKPFFYSLNCIHSSEHCEEDY